MSLSDDLKEAAQNMEDQKKEETVKKKKKTRRSSSKEWSKDDELIALFLYLADSSKMIRENYAAKRNISARAMTLRITVFQQIDKSVPNITATEQTRAIFSEWSRKSIDEIKDSVIGILRGEFSLSAEVAAEAPAED